jgi:hypothetical protein
MPQAPASRWYKSAPLRVLALLALFTAAAAYEGVHLSAFTSADIWWHLRTGLWILQNHGVPHDGLFSQHAKLPWVDSSWGFDLLTAATYRVLGLRSLPALLMAFQVAIALALFGLARGSRRNFWSAVLLVAVAQYCVSPLQLRPALCSILLLALELAVLFHSRRTGDARVLYSLPVLFIAWVNVDRQFSYGLLVLALFCAAVIAEYFLRNSGVAGFKIGRPNIALRGLGAVFAVCFLATFVSPYTYHLHGLVWQSATTSAIDRYLRELHAMRFRQPQDFLLMLLVMTAFFALGRRRSGDLVPIALMVVCTVISFRFQRDSWLVVVASVGVIGDALTTRERESLSEPAMQIGWTDKLVTAALVVIALATLTLRMPGQHELLMARVGESFPVRACDYIRQSRLPQPLFNSYFWGGFLTWYLPEYPVVIDGRVDLYGDAVNIPYFQLTMAEIPLESHPDFAQAQTILLEANSPIAEALATLPGFRVVYRDEQAMVIVRVE